MSELDAPHDPQAEAAVLGSVLLGGRRILDEVSDTGLLLSSFYVPLHQEVFAAMLALDAAGQPLDAVSLNAALAGGVRIPATFLVDLQIAVPTPANAAWYARIVVEHAHRRSLLEAGTRFMSTLRTGDLEAVQDRLEADLLAASQSRSSSWVRLADTHQPQLDLLADVAAGRAPLGLPTGYPDLDVMLGGGLRPGQLVVVAARPSVGKSLVAANWAWHAAARLARGVGFMSLEMSRGELWTRFMAMSTGIAMDRLVDPSRLDDADWERLRGMDQVLASAPLWVDDSMQPTLPALRSGARSLARRGKLDLLVVDYLQLMSSPVGRSENRQQEVSDISRGLKRLATELQVPVVALSQLNRGLESRPSKRPQLSDLRESGAVENDADVVVLLHRPDMYAAPGEAIPQAGEVELLVAKNRQGGTGSVHMAAQTAKSRYVPLAYGSLAANHGPF